MSGEPHRRIVSATTLLSETPSAPPEPHIHPTLHPPANCATEGTEKLTCLEQQVINKPKP